MIHAVFRLASVLAPTILVVGGAAGLVTGCAASGPPLPIEHAGSPVYRCADGQSFTEQFDTTTHQTDLFRSGGPVHRLDPVPDPLGGVLYQDADYQLRPTSSDRVFALTDRSTTLRKDCTR